MTRQLADAVRVLASNDEQLRNRVAAVEHDLDDVTGSIRQVAAVNEARRADDGPTVSAIASLTASSTAPINPPPPPPHFKPARPRHPQHRGAAPPPTQYGVDIGSGLTLQALRARWQTLRAAHPALLEGMQPIVRVSETPHGSKIELRLVVGPLAQPGAASQLCSALTMFGMFCQPAVYDGQHLARGESRIKPWRTPANSFPPLFCRRFCGYDPAIAPMRSSGPMRCAVPCFCRPPGRPIGF